MCTENYCDHEMYGGAMQSMLPAAVIARNYDSQRSFTSFRQAVEAEDSYRAAA
mgnify:CR=1 FL=1